MTGITISDLQCEKAKIFARKEGFSDKIKFYIQDFNKTNFPDKSFDIIWSLESACYAQNKKAFIKETYRILKNGGKLIVADGFIKKGELSKLDQFFLNNWIKMWALLNLAKVGDFQQSLKGAGFKNIEFTDISKNILPSSREIFRRGILGWPIYKLKRKNVIRINHVKGCIFQYLALKKGAWTYGIFYAKK